jgi:hypothetical protein
MNCIDCDIVFEGLPIQCWEFEGRQIHTIATAGPGIYRVLMAPLPPGNGFVRVQGVMRQNGASIPDPATPFALGTPAITLVGSWASGPNPAVSIASQIVFRILRTQPLNFELASADHCVIVERYAQVPVNYPESPRT